MNLLDPALKHVPMPRRGVSSRAVINDAMEPEDYPVKSRPMIVDVVERLDRRISCDGLRYSRCMSNEDQQQTASRTRTVGHDLATAPEADRSPAPTALLILASDDDLVCVDDLCLPGEAAAETRT